jgi:predicted component of type VI protein secretion system
VQFLLERLVNRTDPDMGLAPPFDLADAVMAQVQRIVSCRSDVAARSIAIDGFGLPGIVDTGGGVHDLERYGDRLARAIARYEPRLRDITVEWVATGRALQPRALVVHGCLPGSDEPTTFRFEMPEGEGSR